MHRNEGELKTGYLSSQKKKKQQQQLMVAQTSGSPEGVLLRAKLWI